MRDEYVLLTIGVLACGVAARGAEKEGVAVGRPFGKSPEGQATGANHCFIYQLHENPWAD